MFALILAAAIATQAPGEFIGSTPSHDLVYSTEEVISGDVSSVVLTVEKMDASRVLFHADVNCKTRMVRILDGLIDGTLIPLQAPWVESPVLVNYYCGD